jgi:hypothetical protein
MRGFLILLFLFLNTALVAQLGLKAGFNISNITSSEQNIEDLKGKFGFQAGFIYNFKVTEVFRGRTGLNYIRKGAKYSLDNVDVDLEMDYAELPILLVLKPIGLPFTFQIGPQFSYLIRTSNTYSNSILFEEGSTTITDPDFSDRTDLGIAVGFTYEFPKYFLELRYTKGFSDFEKERNIEAFTTKPSSQHFNIQASFGIHF